LRKYLLYYRFQSLSEVNAHATDLTSWLVYILIVPRRCPSVFRIFSFHSAPFIFPFPLKTHLSFSFLYRFCFLVFRIIYLFGFFKQMLVRHSLYCPFPCFDFLFLWLGFVNFIMPCSSLFLLVLAHVCVSGGLHMRQGVEGCVLLTSVGLVFPKVNKKKNNTLVSTETNN
jgi:hypothetical protein